MHSQMIDQPRGDLPVELIREPGAIKTFGVIHLCIAGCGILYTLFAIVSSLFTKNIFGSMPAAASDQMDAALQYANELALVTNLQYAGSLILGVLLIIAGIQLLKVRDAGRRLSIKYALLSLTFKAIYFFVTMLYIMPKTKAFTDAMYRDIPGGPLMGSLVQFMTLAGVLAGCIYPTIVLIMMRGKTIKDYLAGR